MISSQILYTALVTPFSKDCKKIDFVSLEKILTIQSEADNAILLLGSTGESLSLSDEERKSIVEFTCNLKLQKKIDTQIVVGVPSYNLEIAMDWLNYANNLPIDGYLMTTPIYTKPGIVGQTQWFDILLENSKHPSILYNIPSRSGVKLHSETIKNLSMHPKFVAIKDSGGTIEGMIEFKLAAPNIKIFCGDDNMIESMGCQGAIGLISVASNVWPNQVRKYVKNCLSKCTPGSDYKSNINSKLWHEIFEELFVASNPIPIKALMRSARIIENDSVRLPLSSNDLQSIKQLLNLHEQIINSNE